MLDDEQVDNIDLNGVNYVRWWIWWKKLLYWLCHVLIITLEFDQFECACYTCANLIYLVSFVKYLLGSKELGNNVLELQCVMLANHDQNI